MRPTDSISPANSHSQKDLNALLRLKQVLELIPQCKASFYNGIKRGIYPAPIKVGKSSYWRYRDIIAIIEGLGA
ncbi:transcriptional regulator [Candidatus Nomurabacteria bacterium]|nr:transcriptional regulator [Candidatus Nomurabacteria bacterium]